MIICNLHSNKLNLRFGGKESVSYLRSSFWREERTIWQWSGITMDDGNMDRDGIDVRGSWALITAVLVMLCVRCRYRSQERLSPTLQLDCLSGCKRAHHHSSSFPQSHRTHHAGDQRHIRSKHKTITTTSIIYPSNNIVTMLVDPRPHTHTTPSKGVLTFGATMQSRPQ